MAEANATQLQQQQQQITDLQSQIDALKNQQSKFYSISSQVAPGGCDQGVTHDATQRGEQKLSARDYEAALGYFEDAQSACPNSAEAELNLARVYEAMGERDQAVPHYRRAIELAKDSDPAIASQARTALSRSASYPN
jgi:tetratricopeptide (TPR) repeat protein